MASTSGDLATETRGGQSIAVDRPVEGLTASGEALATRRRMLSPGITSLVFVTAMLSGTDASPTRGPSRSIQGSELAVEIVEHRSAKPSSFGFVVPTEGKIEAWITSGKDGRHCRVQAAPRGSDVHLELRCDGGKDHELRVEATREFKAKERVKLAEVQRPGGVKSQVFVTLR